MKKTVFFDLGNVLLYFSHEKMFRQIAEFCKAPIETIQSMLFQKNWGDMYERGDIDSRTLHHELSSVLGKSLEFPGLMHAMSNIFEPNESMIPLIKELKKNEVELLILSNTCEAHFDYAYTHYPILHLFDGFILSYEVKSRKPEAKIFEHALSKASAERKNCFYTDDIEEYVKSARGLGIDAEQYTNTQQLLVHLKERSFLSDQHNLKI